MRIPLRQLLVVMALVVAGAWSALTIHFQTELFPIFPQNLSSVRGLEVSQQAFASGREAIVVAQLSGRVTPDLKQSATRELQRALGGLPDVETTAALGAGPPVAPEKLAAWLIARLPEASLAKLRAQLSPPAVRSRLAETRARLSGAADPETMALLRYDPLGLSEFLEQETGLNVSALAPPPPGKSKFVAVLARSRNPLPNFESCQKFVAEIRNALPSIAGAKIFITGRPAFVAEASSQMKGDMIRMIALAAALVALAFYLFYRSLLPLICILLLQALAVLSGLIAARLIFGELNVLSMGFACIILGVGMDYCILVYHHHVHHGHEGADPVWRMLRRSIWISAVTTAASFGILFFSSFPGFKQLSLLIAAGLLMTAYLATGLLPELLSLARAKLPVWLDKASDQSAAAVGRLRSGIRLAFFAAIALVFCTLPLWSSYPFYDPDLSRLQPAESEASQGQKLLMDSGKGEAAIVVFSGRSWQSVRAQAGKLAKAKSLDLSGALLWVPADAPPGNWKPVNSGAMLEAFRESGFGDKWAAFTLKVLSELNDSLANVKGFEAVDALQSDFISAQPGKFRLLARLPGTECALKASPREFWNKISEVVPSALPVSWELLKAQLSDTAASDFKKLSGWMLLLILALCWMAHRSLRLVALNFFALAASLVLMFVFLRLTSTSMSLLSLLAVPLLIGLVVDISLHLLIVLEQSGGDLKTTFRHLFVPVSLTGLTSMIGFGTPMISRQPALQNFGFVMDLGILAAVTTGLVFLPAFYFRRPARTYSHLLYRAAFLEIGSSFCRLIGLRTARVIGRLAALLYSLIHPGKTELVRSNISLLLKKPASTARARKVFASYGVAIADYLTLGNVPKEQAMELIYEKQGLENLEQVRDAGSGCLIVTAHLGLFEFGGLLLSEFGFKTIALTLPEPSPGLTEWRARYRKRWGIETLEIGEEDFSFLKIVEQINRGNFVAALADRPRERSRVDVDLPGGKVPFSSGPVLISLLARCPIVPGAIYRLPSGGYRMEAYRAIHPKWLPQGREETLRFYTEEIARALTPAMCKYPEQWYQFGPLSY